MTSQTVGRILNASLRLFNEHGFQNVSAAQIAREIGISGGNLAYHFGSKHDIVKAFFPLLSEEVRGAKQPEGPFLARDAAYRQITIFHMLWRYRFFFNGLIQLLHSEPSLRREYGQLQEGVLDSIEGLFEELVSQGYFRRPKAPLSTRLVALNLWMVWLSWLRFQQIRTPKRRTPSTEALRQGALINLTVLSPYLDSAFCHKMQGEVETLLSAWHRTNPSRL
jgi:AcrR family transcriptional regulator